MEPTAVAALLDEARRATDRCDWTQALRVLREADARHRLDADALRLLAEVAYAAGDLDATIGTWERLHADRLGAGDAGGAAMAATRVAMHLMMDTGLMAPVRAWVRRAERLLEGHAEAEVHAWLAVARTYERLLSGDVVAAQHEARVAARIGADQDAPAAHAMGRVAEARGVILAGDVGRGLELLDEAAIVAISGEVDPLTVGLLYCELVCAWQGLAQYDRAEEWTEAMDRWCEGHSMGSVRGRCRVHRAEILRLRGRHQDAEEQALAACEELRPILRREFGWPLTELGRIRLQQGDLDGAADAFLEAYEAGWEPQPWQALLSLARGEVAAALTSIDAALEHPLDVPSKELPPNTELRRAPLLGAHVEICLAAGDVDRARASADELARIAEAFDSPALAAAAATACARIDLATGELDSARDRFEHAVQLWTTLAAPYEGGQARMGLAATLRAQGDEHHAARAFHAARATFERIGAWRAADEAAACADGSTPEGAATGLGTRGDVDDATLRHEGDTWSITFDGRSIRLRDLRGLQYLARLLTDPGREFHAMDLVAAQVDPDVRGRRTEDPETGTSLGGDTGAVLDPTAKAAYRRRLEEVDADIEEARAFGDDERATRALVDREFLVRELASAVGLGGRSRRSGSDAERARASVTRAIRHAMKRIAEHHPTLGEHLDRAVRTGTYCAYLPDPRVPVDWR